MKKMNPPMIFLGLILIVTGSITLYFAGPDGSVSDGHKEPKNCDLRIIDDGNGTYSLEMYWDCPGWHTSKRDGFSLETAKKLKSAIEGKGHVVVEEPTSADTQGRARKS